MSKKIPKIQLQQLQYDFTKKLPLRCQHYVNSFHASKEVKDSGYDIIIQHEDKSTLENCLNIALKK